MSLWMSTAVYILRKQLHEELPGYAASASLTPSWASQDRQDKGDQQRNSDREKGEEEARPGASRSGNGTQQRVSSCSRVHCLWRACWRTGRR